MAKNEQQENNELQKAEALKALKAEFEERRAAINAQRRELNAWYFEEKAKIMQ